MQNQRVILSQNEESIQKNLQRKWILTPRYRFLRMKFFYCHLRVKPEGDSVCLDDESQLKALAISRSTVRECGGVLLSNAPAGFGSGLWLANRTGAFPGSGGEGYRGRRHRRPRDEPG